MKAIEFEQHNVDFAKHRVARGLGIDVDEDRSTQPSPREIYPQ